MATDLINQITLEDIPEEQELSTIFNSYKGKRDTSEKENKRLKLTDQILEINKRVIANLL